MNAYQQVMLLSVILFLLCDFKRRLQHQKGQWMPSLLGGRKLLKWWIYLIFLCFWKEITYTSSVTFRIKFEVGVNQVPLVYLFTNSLHLYYWFIHYRVIQQEKNTNSVWKEMIMNHLVMSVMSVKCDLLLISVLINNNMIDTLNHFIQVNAEFQVIIMIQKIHRFYQVWDDLNQLSTVWGGTQYCISMVLKTRDDTSTHAYCLSKMTWN